MRKSQALRDVSITVARGECYGLAGPNGAGKTTLIRLLLGLAAPDAGEVRLLGHRPDDPEVRRRVGFVPEAAEMPPAASPRALVRRFARLRGLTLAAARDVMRREGLQIEAERQNGAATARDDDRVVDTDIPAGKLVPPGAAITVLTVRRSAS